METLHTPVLLCVLPFRSRVYREGAFQTPFSIPFVTFYEPQGLWW